jgi:serine/threonine-protein kinase
VLGGKYRITNKIGSGGIGVVYAAEHMALGSQVAIKVLRGAAAKDASEIARLRREAQVQVTIEHPNVVRTLDLDQMADGSIYVVMELLRISLADKLARTGIIAPDSRSRFSSRFAVRCKHTTRNRPPRSGRVMFFSATTGRPRCSTSG